MLIDMLCTKEETDICFPVRLYRVCITDEDKPYEQLYKIMPPERQKKADRLKNDKVRNRCIAAYALLDHAVGDLWSDIHPQKALPDRPFGICESEKGKPAFTDIPVCFNISHSGDRIIVALSPLEVGCDVEHKSSNALKVAKRFFSKKEYDALKALHDGEEAAARFTGLWTIKESVVKCCGEGIGRGFDDFSVVDDHGNTPESVRLPGEEGTYHIREYPGEGGYRYSVCSLYERFEDEIRDVVLEIH